MRIAETRTLFVSVIGFIVALVSIASVFFIGEVTRYSAWMSFMVVPLLLLFFLGTITSFVAAIYLLLTGMKASAWMKGILVLVLILDALMAVLYIEFQRGIPFEKIPEDILKQVLLVGRGGRVDETPARDSIPHPNPRLQSDPAVSVESVKI